MRYTAGFLTLFLLAGCSGLPPKPPMPEGEYRPINRLPAPAKKDVFDFSYEGDVLGVLPALRDMAPHISVMPSIGNASPFAVKLDLKSTSLENALRAIGEQCGDVAEVVWNTTRHQTGNQVFIRFRDSKTE